VKRFETFEGLVAPLDRSNVDTDAIIAKQFIKSIAKTGYGPYLFDQWRYCDAGELGQDCTHRPRNPDFVLNDPRYASAQILLARDNFGCGSSREHAVWALQDFGFRVVIAPSFADIFHGNCYRNGLLPIVLPSLAIESLFVTARTRPADRMRIDLSAQCVDLQSGAQWSFEIDAFRKRCLLEGLDEIALTLIDRDDILRYEAQRRMLEPWLFGDVA